MVTSTVFQSVGIYLSVNDPDLEISSATTLKMVAENIGFAVPKT